MGMSYKSTSPCPSCDDQRQQQQQQQQLESLQAMARRLPSSISRSSVFPESLQNMVVDYGTVPRQDFNKHLQVGVPFEPDQPGAEDVLVLYTSPKSLPNAATRKGRHRNDNNATALLGLSSHQAFENCHSVKVILQEPSKRRQSQQCIAIVPQWESYYVHKFMRLPETKMQDGVDLSHPLRYVSRSHSDNGRFGHVPDLDKHTRPSYEVLHDYIGVLDNVLKQLRRQLKTQMHQSKQKGPAAMKESNAFIVMVCNRGQSLLLWNFACNAKAKGLDLSRVIVFATDDYTKEMAQGLGLHVFANKAIFGAMPEAAAKFYGDRSFQKMMMAKVFCVHLVLSCGYDVLFQDVDVVMFRNPLEFFLQDELREWDMMFQDDGARTVRYQPYSPNTGFYYVRNNPTTMFFFGTLLRMGDLVAATKSHQASLTALLNEFASWKGLRVKVWRMGLNDGSPTPFPGGAEYHRHNDYMRELVDEKIHPWVFHMSWTENKDNKKLFFEQMGEWYLQEDTSSCSSPADCCLPQPNITCHYNDKPSKIPCKEAPRIDKKGKSFW
jgi:hypothetical protein